MRFGLIFVLASLVFASPTLAANQCYSSAELQAEQLLRLHSELMVITVSCRKGSDGENLVSAYTGFTKAHVKAIRDAEDVMKHYYSAAFGGNGTSRLDKLRTRLANEFGQKSANMSSSAFCQRFRDKVLTYYDTDEDGVQGEVKRMVSSEKSYGRLCKPESTRVASKDK